MNKYKPTLKALSIVLLMSIALFSCEKSENTVLYKTYGIAYPVEGESYKFKIKSDYGSVFIPASNNYLIDTISRVFGTFSFVNEADYDEDSAVVNFQYMENILFKAITNIGENLGDAESYVKEGLVWQSEHNNLLNIQFEYNGGNETHSFNLFYNDTLSNADTALLEFRHNNNADLAKMRLTGLVSFDLNSLENHINVSDSIIYKVTFNKGTTAIFLDEWIGVYKPE